MCLSSCRACLSSTRHARGAHRHRNGFQGHSGVVWLALKQLQQATGCELRKRQGWMGTLPWLTRRALSVILKEYLPIGE